MQRLPPNNTDWRKLQIKFEKTRMHSSRMRTVRCSSRLRGGGGGCLLGGVCLLGEVSACRGGVCLPGGCLPARGVVCLGGVCLPGGVHLPPPRGQTDTCENITFPQLLLRTVKINTIFSFENTARHIVFSTDSRLAVTFS